MKKTMLLFLLLLSAAATWYFWPEIQKQIDTMREINGQKKLEKQESPPVQVPQTPPLETKKPIETPAHILSVSCPGATLWFDSKTFENQMEVSLKPGTYPLFCFNESGWYKGLVTMGNKDIGLSPQLKPFLKKENRQNQALSFNFPQEICWSAEVKEDLFPNLAFSDTHLLATSRKGFIYCLDQETGQIAWKKEIGSDLSLAPVVWNEFIFAASATGKLLTFEASRGKEKNPIFNSGEILGMTVLEDHLIFWTALGEVVKLSLKQSVLKGLKTKEEWRISFNSNPDHFFRFQCNPILDQGAILIQTSPSSLICLDTQGNVLFNKDIIPDVLQNSNPAQKTLKSSRKMKLEFIDSSFQLPPPLLEMDRVWLVTHQEDDFALVCLNLGKGEVLWSSTLDHAPSGNMFRLMGMIFVGTEQGSILCFDAENGLPLFETTSPSGNPVFQGVVHGASLFIASDEGLITQRQAFSETSIPKLNLKGNVKGASLHSRNLYVSGENGAIWKVK